MVYLIYYHNYCIARKLLDLETTDSRILKLAEKLILDPSNEVTISKKMLAEINYRNLQMTDNNNEKLKLLEKTISIYQELNEWHQIIRCCIKQIQSMWSIEINPKLVSIIIEITILDHLHQEVNPLKSHYIS